MPATRVRRRHARTVLSLSLLLGVFTCHGVASNTSAPNSSLVMGNVAFRDVLELWMSNVAFRESLELWIHPSSEVKQSKDQYGQYLYLFSRVLDLVFGCVCVCVRVASISSRALACVCHWQRLWDELTVCRNGTAPLVRQCC